MSNALPVSQQAYIYRADFDGGKSISLSVKNHNNGVYVFVVDGEVSINNMALGKRDAIGVWDVESFEILAHEDSKIIIVEVPMN